jgi:hypothetical protein
MISNDKILYWARNKLDAAGFDTTNDFAFVNRNFDSSDKDIWFRERIAIAAEGQDTNKTSNVKNGLMWYDCVVDRGAGNEESDSSAVAITELFNPQTNKQQTIESGLAINIDEATTGTPVIYEDTKYLTPVRIAFRVYETL